MVRQFNLEEKKEIAKLQKIISQKRLHSDFIKEVKEEIRAIKKYGL